MAQLAQHKISSIVQNAVQNVTADALRNAVVAGNSGVAVSSAVQAAAAINSLTAVQSGHGSLDIRLGSHFHERKKTGLQWFVYSVFISMHSLFTVLHFAKKT